MLFDDTNIYIACRCWDEHPERIVANDMRRDSSNLRQHDNFAVAFDTFHDGRNGFLFYVTPVGGMFDAATTRRADRNSDWNTVWDGKASRFDGGWIAEMAIPFKSLRYAPGREQTWGIQLRRDDPQQERARLHHADVAGVGHRRASIACRRRRRWSGLEAPPAALNLEIKPYAISRLTTDLREQRRRCATTSSPTPAST